MISFHLIKRASSGNHLPKILQPIEIELFFEENKLLIERLEIAYSDQASWQSKILPCIRQLALVTGRLPYRPKGIFSSEGDLFRASLTAATYAIEIMESTVELEKNIMAQHLLQGRLKASAALASLCSFLDAFQNLQIAEVAPQHDDSFFHISEANHIKNVAFEPLAMPYIQWVKEKLSKNSDLKLQLHWNTQTHPLNHSKENLRLFLARHVLCPETLAWLADAGPLPLLELMNCLSGNAPLTDIPSSVIKARDLGVYRTCLLERERLGKELGEILAPDGWQETLIRILRTRIVNDWEINAKDSPLRKGADGLFLFWPDVCPILIDDMKKLGLVDLPTDPDIWAGCLLSSGISMISQKGTATCMIAVTPNAKPREAIKLSDTYFLTASRILYAKTIKRDFEVKLTLDQSAGLSQLTREVMQISNKAFTEQLPEKTPSQPTLIWQLAIEIQQNDLKDALHSFTSFMTSHKDCLSETLIDEGFFFSEALYHQIDTSLSFERLVLSLLTSNLIYQTERNEPLWVTHTDKNATLQRGVILKPDLFEAILNHEVLTFEKAFRYVFQKAPHPNFSFKEKFDANDQLSFNFEGD